MSMHADKGIPFADITPALNEKLPPAEYSSQANNNHINAYKPPPPSASLNRDVITQQPFQVQPETDTDQTDLVQGTQEPLACCVVCCCVCLACRECIRVL